MFVVVINRIIGASIVIANCTFRGKDVRINVRCAVFLSLINTSISGLEYELCHAVKTLL